MVVLLELARVVVVAAFTEPVAITAGDVFAIKKVLAAVLIVGMFDTNGPIRLFKPLTGPVVPVVPSPGVTAPAFATVPLSHASVATR